MKTRSRWFHLRGLFLLSVGFVFGAMLSAPAFAGTSKSRELVRPEQMTQQAPAQKMIKIYIVTSASAIPKPISYVVRGVMTTAIPVQIIGRSTTITL